MTLTVSAYHSLLLRAIKPNRITSAFCIGNAVNKSHLHSKTVYQKHEKFCKHKDHQLVSKPGSDSHADYNTELHNDLRVRSFNNRELTPGTLVCYSQKITSSSSIHLKQFSRIPYNFNKFNSASITSSSGLLLNKSSAFCHQSSASHTCSCGSPTKVNSFSRSFLMRQTSILQTSQPRISSFSTLKFILESTPSSFQPYLRLIRFDKPIGSWLLYWPCTWSIALAAEPGCMPDLRLLALFGAGAFFMRGAGCIINDMWDKDLDVKVARTRLRPLAAGEITQFQALVFLGVQLSCALAILLQLNNYSIILGAASLSLVVTYPLFKRFTYWPQLMLGLTLNWGVLLAWSAIRGSVELPGLVLYLTCTLYTVIYDTIYSHQWYEYCFENPNTARFGCEQSQKRFAIALLCTLPLIRRLYYDKYDDMLIGIKSTAILLGDQTKPWLSVFTAVMMGGLTFSGYLCDMTWPYYSIVGLAGIKLAHQIYSVNLNDADECSQAFRGNFYLGAVVFAGIVLANFLRTKEAEEVKAEIEESQTQQITATEVERE